MVTHDDDIDDDDDGDDDDDDDGDDDDDDDDNDDGYDGSFATAAPRFQVVSVRDQEHLCRIRMDDLHRIKKFMSYQDWL